MRRDDALAELGRARAALDALEVALADDAGDIAPAPVAPVEHPAAANFDASVFFDRVRAAKVLGADINQGEVDGCNAILQACQGWPASWVADALATADIETNGTMQPVKEAYWLSSTAANAWFVKMYDIQGARPDKARELGNTEPGDGAKYAGRGYAQVTGKTNYQRAEAAVGAPLLSNPDLALSADYAAKILRHGMEDGWFTGKSLNDYLPAVATREQFRNARRVINGQDRADDIAGIAMIFQDALQAGGWR